MLWNDSFAIGVEQIDTQHQELFRRLELLMEQVIRAQDHPIMLEMVEFLSQYTLSHFRDEERLMAQIDFPGLAEHRLLHQEFLREITLFRRDLQLDASHRPSITNLIGYLTDWLVQHVLEEDQRIGEHLHQRPADQN